ncbi:DUF935 domain-containing protein [Amphritea sp. 2_MG-2023]|uniref:DUF935 domain-containing protein n=1 Tax=Amphritea TaxID=515417 RepID=UPI001C069C09|nr:MULTISPECIES: DUF935 domain-containing protein [Amphritea]MBU2967069.1 DUF935 domain-containing protein [Amphritea atlantica]MDO6419378.1 DUF935 domain-containing protein [Amphritea sp. 2_MG-2023]
MAKSSIVDINGQPFSLSDLVEPQTSADAKLAQLHRHYGDHPSSGLTPAKLATIMREAEQGNLIRQCELAEDIEEKDAHVQSELGKRRLAMQGPDWNIIPPANASAAEQRDAEMIEEQLRSATWLDEAIFDCGDAILKSFSNLELSWAFEDKTHFIADVEWRDPSWFQVNPNQRDQLTLRDGSYEGEPLRPFGWISHQAKAKSGYLARRGLVRVLAWPFLFKNYSVRDLAEFLEIYGLPLRLGKYPEGASEREKLTLLRAVMSIGHNAGGIIPKGMEIEFEKAADGASDPFMAMIAWCEKSQSKAILGGTLTSQADGKSSTNALGNVHNEVRQEIRDADLKSLAATLTRDVVYPMYVLNGTSFRNPRRIPRLEFDLNEPEDLQQFAQPLSGLVSLGMKIPTSWVYEKTKIPQPSEGEEVLQLSQSAGPALGAQAQGAEEVALAALKAEPSSNDEIDTLVDNVQAQADQHTDDLLDTLRQLVDNADSLTQLREQLMALQLDNADLTEVMSQALTVAALAGRYELLQDAE